ncbi:MAG: hypothetical protein KJZ75_01445 [Hyphomonadaceae bacterium]|nr:hypothetical protein [Hyphomonadaceae bacterium]GIK50075.1 MAG: hypothetical protein BroJett013_27720 [Alphaproteobacteria bacterium]
MKVGRWIGAAALVGAGVLAYRAMQKRKEQRQSEQQSEHLQAHPMPPVRDAGAENMKTPPRRWSRTDERSDESFPASDPPATY